MTHPDAYYRNLADDLLSRVERAVQDVARLAVDTGITFQVADVVDAVERGLPAGYPEPAVTPPTRRDVIAQMTADVIERLAKATQPPES
jgi:predicted Rdx family selenoprotein